MLVDAVGIARPHPLGQQPQARVGLQQALDPSCGGLSLAVGHAIQAVERVIGSGRVEEPHQLVQRILIRRGVEQQRIAGAAGLVQPRQGRGVGCARRVAELALAQPAQQQQRRPGQRNAGRRHQPAPRPQQRGQRQQRANPGQQRALRLAMQPGHVQPGRLRPQRPQRVALAQLLRLRQRVPEHAGQLDGHTQHGQEEHGPARPAALLPGPLHGRDGKQQQQRQHRQHVARPPHRPSPKNGPQRVQNHRERADGQQPPAQRAVTPHEGRKAPEKSEERRGKQEDAAVRARQKTGQPGQQRAVERLRIAKLEGIAKALPVEGQQRQRGQRDGQAVQRQPAQQLGRPAVPQQQGKGQRQHDGRRPDGNGGGHGHAGQQRAPPRRARKQQPNQDRPGQRHQRLAEQGLGVDPGVGGQAVEQAERDAGALGVTQAGRGQDQKEGRQRRRQTVEQHGAAGQAGAGDQPGQRDRARHQQRMADAVLGVQLAVQPHPRLLVVGRRPEERAFVDAAVVDQVAADGENGLLVDGAKRAAGREPVDGKEQQGRGGSLQLEGGRRGWFSHMRLLGDLQGVLAKHPGVGARLRWRTRCQPGGGAW